MAKKKKQKSVLHSPVNPLGVLMLVIVSVGLIYALVLSRQNVEMRSDASTTADTWVAGLEMSSKMLSPTKIQIQAMITPHPNDLPIKKVDFYYRKVNSNGSYGNWMLISSSVNNSRIHQVEKSLNFFQGLPGTFQITANVYYGRPLPCSGNPSYVGSSFEKCGGRSPYINVKLGYSDGSSSSPKLSPTPSRVFSPTPTGIMRPPTPTAL